MEKIESQLTPEKLLERYDARFTDEQDITFEDLAEMKKEGISTETFLNFLGKKYGYLFHGSRNDIPIAEQIRSSNRGVVFASNDPAISILKAIYLNNAKNLGYPLNIMEDKSNLKLVIDKPKEDTIGEQGYVYIIADKEGFEKDPNSNWQYSKKVREGEGIDFIKRVQVERSDFVYPVEIE